MLQRRSLRLAIVIAAAFGSALLVVPASSTLAAIPPDSCFLFTPATGTITNYYNNQSNNVANPACPKDVEIPTTIGGATVTAVTGPSTSIGAFENKAITSVIIPSTVTRIGHEAFARNLLSTVVIPNSVTTMNQLAFEQNRLTSVILSENLTTIDSGAFRFNQLTSVTIPNNVNSIIDVAFSSNNISSLTIIGTLTASTNTAFVNNPIDHVSYNGVSYYETDPIPTACFSFNTTTGMVTDYHRLKFSYLISQGAACLARDVTIPNTIGGVTVTGITGPSGSAGAFQSNMISSVIIPQTVTTIGWGAFRMNELTSIDLPNSVMSIGNSAFAYNKLTSITIPEGVTTVGDSMLTGNLLESVSLPSTLTSIGYSSFRNNKLLSLDIPDSVTTIADYAFVNNSLQSVNLPSSLISIGYEAFQHNQLSAVALPLTVSSIREDAFYYQHPGYTSDEFWDLFYSLNPEDVTTAINSVRYAQLITADGSNPNSIKDSVWLECIDWDTDGNCIDSVSMGGHLINPAHLHLNHVDEASQTIAPLRTISGRADDGREYPDYFAANGPEIPTPLDSWDITPEESSAISDALQSYFRHGDGPSVDMLEIDGYDMPIPSAKVYNLTAGLNQDTIVYRAAGSETPEEPPVIDEDESPITPEPVIPDDEATTSSPLADTGMNIEVLAAIAGILITIGGTLVVRGTKHSRRSHRQRQ